MTRGSNSEEQVITYESYRRFHSKENNILPQACYDLLNADLTSGELQRLSLTVRPGDAFGEFKWEDHHGRYPGCR